MTRRVDLRDLAEEPLPFDPVDNPAHYAGDGQVDCKRAMRSMHAGWARCRNLYPMTQDYEEQFIGASYWATTAFKYIWRWVGKNGKDDLLKARECLDIAIDSLTKTKEN